MEPDSLFTQWQCSSMFCFTFPKCIWKASFPCFPGSLGYPGRADFAVTRNPGMKGPCSFSPTLVLRRRARSRDSLIHRPTKSVSLHVSYTALGFVQFPIFLDGNWYSFLFSLMKIGFNRIIKEHTCSCSQRALMPGCLHLNPIGWPFTSQSASLPWFPQLQNRADNSTLLRCLWRFNGLIQVKSPKHIQQRERGWLLLLLLFEDRKTRWLA